MTASTRSICNIAIRPVSIFRQLPLQTSSICIHARYASILSSISDNPGAYNKRIRRGRGPGSGKGKTSGRGHKGQGQHGKVPAGFNGGQSTYEDTHGVRGFDNPFSEDMTTLNLDRLQSWIDQGRINPSRPITLIELVRSGCIGRIADGVKLLARGSDNLKTPVHIIVSRASPSAISAIENLGGTVTTRYYTPFAIKNILRGKMHPAHSRLFQPTAITNLIPHHEADETYALPDPVGRKNLEYYRDSRHRGYLSYQVPVGQTPSLYFKTPGVGVLTGPRTGAKKVASSDTLW